MPHRTCASIVLTTLIAGCATYQPPTSCPMAQMGFVKLGDGQAELSIFEQSRGCVGRRKVAELGNGESATFVIRAGAPLTIEFHPWNTYTRIAYAEYSNEEDLEYEETAYCFVNIRFTPEAGKEYALGTNEEKWGLCGWMLVERGGDGKFRESKAETIDWYDYGDGRYCAD